MNTQNLSTAAHHVNGAAREKPTISQVISWIESQISKGDMGADGGRLRITSVNAMADMVADDEPGDAQSVMENMDRLRERWARKNPESKTDTANTYSTRAKTSIAAYLEWSAAPDKYDPRRVLQKKGDGSKAAPSRKPRQATPVYAPEPVAPAPQQTTRGSERSFPLSEDRDFVYVVPKGGITTAEVRKLAFHLWTLASDFDPGQSFGLTRVKEE